MREVFRRGGKQHNVLAANARYTALTAMLPNLLQRVSMRVEAELITFLWNAMVNVAEDVSNVVKNACEKSMLAQEAGNDGVGAGPAELPADAEDALAQLAHAAARAAMSAAAEAVRRKPSGGEELRATVQAKMTELVQLFNEAKIPYDVSILGDADASQPVRAC